jgi:hypothetical protein
MTSGPALHPLTSPARAHPLTPLRGRIRSDLGAPVINPPSSLITFTIGTPALRWETGAPEPSVISSSSAEQVPVPVRAIFDGNPHDPTGDQVQVSFTRGYGVKPSSWELGTWGTGSYLGWHTASVLVGPGGVVTLTPGTYTVWVRVADNPEIPVRQAGTVQIT